MLASHRVSKIDVWPIQRPTIQPMWAQSTSSSPGVPIAEIHVEQRAGDTWALRLPDTSSPCYFEVPLFIDNPFPPFLMIFSRPQVWLVPIQSGKHTPRIEIDGIVINENAGIST